MTEDSSAQTAPGSEAASPPGIRDYLGVSLYWFALSFFWGSMLALILPHRVEQIVGAARKDQTLGMILAMGASVAGLTQVLSGAVSDIFGSRWGQRRPYVVAGTVAASVPLLLFPLATTPGTLLAVYLGLQFLLNLAIGPYQALLPDKIPLRYHGRASAYMGVWQLLGRIGGPLVAGLLLGARSGLIIACVLFVVMLNGFMLAYLLLIRESPTRTPDRALSGHLREIVNVPLRPYPSFVWVLLSRFGVMLGFYTVLSFLLYYIEYTLGVGEKSAPKVLAAFMVVSTVTGLFGVIPAGRLSDRVLKTSVLFVANGICICAAIVFVAAGSLTVAYAAVAVFGAGFGAFTAVDWALGCNLLPEHARAKYLGVWGLSDTVPQIIAPLVAGQVAAIFNRVHPGAGYRALMVIAILYYILGTLALTQIKERRA